MQLIDLIAGTRPNFVKLASIIAALDAHREAGGRLRYRFIHTGQHYDHALSQSFLDDLRLPRPHANLAVGASTPAEQTGAIMVGYEALLRQKRADCCLVVGDVTSTIACALTARRTGIPVAHVEGGIRCGDWTMPEENNRLATDAISNWFFTTSEVANDNLKTSGVDASRIHFVGNTMIDTLLANLDRIDSSEILTQLQLQPRSYFLLTLHRSQNVDEVSKLQMRLAEIAKSARGCPILFPVHPRTRQTLAAIRDLPDNIHAIAPQPYLAFNHLLRNSKAVLTDSGGVTEEATVLGVPCMTLRPSTERPETVSIGTNEIIGDDPAKLRAAFERLFAGKWKRGAVPKLWDGKASSRIIASLDRILAA